MDYIEEVIEKKIVEVLTNNTKLRYIISQQINKNELDDASIIGITLLMYLLALLVSYYSILLYQHISYPRGSSENQSPKSLPVAGTQATKKRKRRIATRSHTTKSKKVSLSATDSLPSLSALPLSTSGAIRSDEQSSSRVPHIKKNLSNSDNCNKQTEQINEVS